MLSSLNNQVNYYHKTNNQYRILKKDISSLKFGSSFAKIDEFEKDCFSGKNIDRLLTSAMYGNNTKLNEFKNEYNLKTIIDLRGDFFEASDVKNEHEACEDIGIEHIPILIDTEKGPDKSQIKQFLKIMADSAKKPLYIHCHHGIDRTGLMIAIYKMDKYGVSYEKAKNEWVARGHKIGEYPALDDCLAKFNCKPN